MHKQLVILAVITLAAIGGVAGIVFAQKRGQEGVESCQIRKINHTVRIRNNVAEPKIVRGQLCDTLTIINNDPRTRKIGFGDHDKHVTYGGILEQLLGPNESLGVVLSKTGTYEYHDHYMEQTGGTFTVR